MRRLVTWRLGLRSFLHRRPLRDQQRHRLRNGIQNNRWYRVRLRVTGDAVQVWVDDKQIIDLDTEGYKLSVSEEMKRCLPLGIATWKTTGTLRSVC